MYLVTSDIWSVVKHISLVVLEMPQTVHQKSLNGYHGSILLFLDLVWDVVTLSSTIHVTL